MIFSNCLLHGGPKGLSGCPVDQPKENSCEGVRLVNMMVVKMMMVVIMVVKMTIVMLMVVMRPMVMQKIMWSPFAMLARTFYDSDDDDDSGKGTALILALLLSSLRR